MTSICSISPTTLNQLAASLNLGQFRLTSCRSAASGAPHATAPAACAPAARRLQRRVRRLATTGRGPLGLRDPRERASSRTPVRLNRHLVCARTLRTSAATPRGR
jgi:hypothetical protein